MKKIILTSLLACTLFACDKKAENVTKLSAIACQDVKDDLEAYLGMVGKALLGSVVTEEAKSQTICDCLTPLVKQEFETKAPQELETMIVDKQMRGRVIKSALSKNLKAIFNCYKEKGLKGLGIGK